MIRTWLLLCTIFLGSCEAPDIKATLTPILAAQTTQTDTIAGPRITPKSMHREEGVTIVSYDFSKPHRSKKHYEKLAQIVIDEFILPQEPIYVLIIFMPEEMKAKVKKNNPGWGPDEKWLGLYIGAATMIISEESDDTFFHEFMHYLHGRGSMLQGYSSEEAHQIIYINEQFLLVSDSYLKYLNSPEAE